MNSLPLFYMMALHHIGGMASAFQSQPQIGFAGHHHITYRRHNNINTGQQSLLPSQHLRTFHANSRQQQRLGDGGVVLLGTESDSTDSSTTSLGGLLEEFAAGIKNEDVSVDASSGSEKEDVASTTTTENDAASFLTFETTNSWDTRTGKVESSDKAKSDVVADDSSNFKSFTPSPDTPLANKYYSKKIQQQAEESKNTEQPTTTTEEEKKTEPYTDVSSPISSTPPPAAEAVSAPTRRRFADFGIASEQAEPINGEETTTSASEDSTTTSTSTTLKSLRFSDQGRPMGIDAKPRPPPDTASNTATNVIPETPSPGDTVKSPAASITKGENPDGAKSSTTQNEKDPPASAPTSNIKDTTTKEEAPSSSVKSITNDEKLKNPDAKKSTTSTKEEKSTPAPTAVVSPPSSSTELIQTQPASPIITLPNIQNLDVEDFGLLPLITIGISVILSLGVYLKNDDAGWDKKGGGDDEKGFMGKITDESKSLFQKVKDAGTAGAISYALWEAAFWGVSFPVCIFSYRQVTGHWPDVMNGEDAKKVGLQAFTFVNLARLAVPVRIGLALSTVPWVDENIVSRFQGLQREEDGEEEGVIANLQDGVGESAPQPQLPYDDDSMKGIEVEDTSAISKVEQRLNKMETEASRISSAALDKLNAGIDPTLLQPRKKDVKRRYVPGNNYLGSIDEYCEAGQVDENCSESIQGYLDTLASTGAVATDGEVKAIVNYLDSVSSNAMPNKKTGAAFTSYLDAISTGYIPPPPSAKAVASYLDVLSSSDEIITSTSSSSPSGAVAAGEGALSSSDDELIGSRINDVEERLSRLESSVTSLPDDIASRLVDWQMGQDKKLSDEMEKIMKLLVDGKALEK